MLTRNLVRLNPQALAQFSAAVEGPAEVPDAMLRTLGRDAPWNAVNPTGPLSAPQRLGVHHVLAGCQFALNAVHASERSWRASWQFFDKVRAPITAVR